MGPHAPFRRSGGWHSKRHDDIRGRSRRELKPSRSDANHRPPSIAQVDRPAHDIRIGPESRRPEIVADHDHRCGAFAQILRTEETPDGGRQAKGREQLWCRREALDSNRIAVVEERGERTVERNKGFEAVLARAEIDDVAERHEILGDAGSDIAIPEHHEVVGVREGQRPQQDGLNEREECGVGPDAEGQCEHCGERESGLTPEQSERVAQVTEEHGGVFPSWRGDGREHIS